MFSVEAAPSSLNKVGTKRKRFIVSCLECHRRKQKCDRLEPCSNCVSRGKQSICQYKNVTTSLNRPTNTPTVGTPQTVSDVSIGPNASTLSLLQPQAPLEHDHVTKDLGYSGHYNYSTLSILRKVTTLQIDRSPTLDAAQQSGKFPDRLSRDYWEVIRLLPKRKIIDTLVDLYFAAVGWQYDVVDEITFRDRLNAWRAVDYFSLQQGPRALSTDMRFFPALLFQILAHVLLNEPPVGDEDLESLKCAPGMTFHDLADEFSEAGNSLTTLLGQTETCMCLIQAHFTRVWFLKSIGRVLDAWHALGLTIRQAQEFGLHVEPDLGEGFSSIDDTYEDKQWADEMHRRMWLILRLWDCHMAVVLGRPLLINPSTPGPRLPRDVQVRSINTGPIERTFLDPPSPFTVILVGYHAAFKYLWTIHELVSKAAESEEHQSVEEIDTTILDNIQSLPTWLRLENSDLRFDELPGYHWLPLARGFLWSQIHLCRLSLHKPFVLSASKRRVAALAAALKVLHSQFYFSSSTPPSGRRLSTSVLDSFDALVVTCSVHLLYPTENHELLSTSLQCISWGLDRLKTMGHQNSIVRKAHGVVSNLYDRLMRLLASSGVAVHAMPTRPGFNLIQHGESFVTDYSANAAISTMSESPGGGSYRHLIGETSDSAMSLDGFAPLRSTHDLLYERFFAGMPPGENLWVYMNDEP